MSVASPKSAAGNPINLDAILVCKKEINSSKLQHPKEEILTRFNNYISRFEMLQRNLSSGDKFVIACSQAISIASILKLDMFEAKELVHWAVINCIPEKQRA
jgi:putative DNA methylase